MRRQTKETRSSNFKDLGPITELLEEENKSLKDELLKISSEMAHTKTRTNNALYRSMGEWESHSRAFSTDEASEKPHLLSLSSRTLRAEMDKPRGRVSTLGRNSLQRSENFGTRMHQRCDNDASTDKPSGIYNELLNVKEAQLLNLQEQLNKKNKELEDAKRQMRNSMAKLQSDIQSQSFENDQMRAEKQKFLARNGELVAELNCLKESVRTLTVKYDNAFKDVGAEITKAWFDVAGVFLASWRAFFMLILIGVAVWIIN